MNLFQKYGIKEVADVVFYSITQIEDEKFYIPVLFLDTLKISSLEEQAETVEHFGGKGNNRVISWNFKKDINLELQDALFSPMSMSLIWGGELSFLVSDYISTFLKCKITNKYFSKNYSVMAYPSPVLTDSEKAILYRALEEEQIEAEGVEHEGSRYLYTLNVDEPFINENREKFLRKYYKRLSKEDYVVPPSVFSRIISYITSIKDLGYFSTDLKDCEVIDRMEKCIVEKEDGQLISLTEQRENLKKYYLNEQSSFVIFYDIKTLMPFLPQDTEDEMVLRKGTFYYKWSRAVKEKTEDDDSVLGKVLTINPQTLSGKYQIIGETFIRNEKTQKDERYQFIINEAVVSPEAKITLEAEGDPTVFDLKIKALTLKNLPSLELKQFNIEEDLLYGGTTILPISVKNNYTPLEKIETLEVIDNLEIY